MESQQIAEAPKKTQRRSYRRRHIELTETDPAKKKIEYRVKYNAMRKAEEGEADILTIEVDDLARAVADVLEKTPEEAHGLAEKIALKIKFLRIAPPSPTEQQPEEAA
ncbi:hypothetical protein PAPYR_12016 [Paratrimastix pyriformis]|uniref:Uncharacterized protein n=1 Tax=Paratrimastix pyriformis TaxID=342808 RepID=A0ABQ8U5A8_9EUKA|nr:hypothetical protein PAPYR_12016 [Paratrimastix pyriformis]